MAAYTEQEILDAFDAAQATYLDWPEFGNMNYDHLSARLIACRDEERWALIFSTIEWQPQEGINTKVLPIGNCVSIPLRQGASLHDEGYYQQELESIHHKFDSSALGVMLKSQGLDMRDFGMNDEEMLAQFRKNDLSGLEYDAKELHLVDMEFDDEEGQDEWGNIVKFNIRGEPVPFRQLKVQPQLELQTEPAFWVAVAATEAYREQMLATDMEIARYFKEGLPPKLLVLNDWCHGATEH
ncbi:MAG TPA: hypothetical protein VIU46_06420, partial [Gallionellaceae bacterium]